METIDKEPSLITSSSAPTLPFTSRFFGDYLDNSNSQIDMSQQHSRSYYEANDAEQYVQTQNRCLLLWLKCMKKMVLRNAIGRWQIQKERIVRRNKLGQPQYVMKVMLKLSMILKIKVKKKCSLFFSAYKSGLKAAKAKEGKESDKNVGSERNFPAQKQQQPKPKPTVEKPTSAPARPVQHQNSLKYQKIQAERIEENNKKVKRLNTVIEGAIKLWQTCLKLRPKYFYPSLKFSALMAIQLHFQQTGVLQAALQGVENAYYRTLDLSWRHFKQWMNHLEKAEILTDTISLMLHERTRFAMLQLKLELSLFRSESRISHLPSHQNSQIQITRAQNNNKIFKKKQNPPNFISIPDQSASALPFNHSAAPADLSQNILTQNIYNYRSTHDHTVVSRNPSQISVLRSEQHSQLTAMKVCKPKSFLIKGKAVSRAPTQDHLNRELNSDFSRQFINVNHSTRALPLRNDELKKDLTDFNDLFFARQVINFYLSSDNKSERSSKVYMSSHVIEQYSRQTLEDSDRRMPPLTFAGTIKKAGKNSKRSSKSRSKESSRDRNIYLSPLAFTSRRKIKIPTQLPKNFDYYADKSHSKSNPKHRKSSSSSIGESLKKNKQFESTKRVFNIVKGSNTDRKISHVELPKDTDSHSKGLRSSKSRAREKSSRSRHDDVSPHIQKDTYMMAFSRHPPKKRTRREF